MISRHFRKIAILIAILAMLLAACGPQETETPEPTEEPVATEEATEEPVEVEETEEPVEATAEAVEATEEMTEEPMDDMEETEEPEEPMDDMEETEEPMDDMEETEEPMSDMEETEEPMDDMEETEEPMDDMEETEEPMDDMEMTEEPMDDMGDGAVVTFDDGAGFTFDYPEGYEVTTNTDSSVITLDMGEQRIIVISPANWALVVGDEEGTLEEQLVFFVERLGYTAGESSDMMMADASINIELPRRGLVGYANLSDVENGNYAVVIELGPDADSIPSADGAVISSSMVMFVVQAEPIAIGDTIAASIETGRRNSYELTLADGDVVNIYLNGLEGLDTYLRVYDADGNLIAENDDFSGVSSGLEGFTVAGGGVVTVEAGTFGDSAAGDYELVVEAAVAEEPMDDMEETEEPMDDMEATEEPMDDMEATEEPMDDMEATEEPMDDMEATEEPMDDMDMDDGAVVIYDDGAGFTFDYPEGYEVTTNTDASVVTLDMGEQRLIVIAPASWALVVGDEEGTLEEQLAFFVERLGYTAGESSDMMMSDASISIELPRRNLVGYANLSDLGDGNIVVVLELGSDADSIPSADGAVISSTVAYNPPPPPEEEAAPEDEAAAESSLTILGVALQTENLQTLLVAVQRGGYLATFNGEGSFTVFAPTDDAFATALDELGLTAEELLDDEELLASVLTYHVVEGAVFSVDLEDGMEVVTLNGAILTINVTDEGVTVTDGNGNTYNVIAADVEASNGVVHIIDGVLLPPME